jgi:hypothetical protein
MLLEAAAAPVGDTRSGGLVRAAPFDHGTRETMMRYSSYMLRIWHRTDADDRQWIGRLEHVADGTAWTFHSVHDMLAQLACLLDAGTRSTPYTAGPGAGDRREGDGTLEDR